MTAVVKNKNNRARSVAAGVVPGAGVGPPVLQKPHFDESASTRIVLEPLVGATVQRTLGKAVQEACACQRMVPGTNAHTKGVTGLSHLNDVVGRWSQMPPAHFDGGELRSNRRDLGTGSAPLKAAKTGSKRT